MQNRQNETEAMIVPESRRATYERQLERYRRQVAYEQSRRREKERLIFRILFSGALLVLILALGAGIRLLAKKGRESFASRYGNKNTGVGGSPSGQLLTGATVSEKLEQIRTHAEIYPQVLREAAEKNSEIVDYVYHYPEKKGTAHDCDRIELSEESSQSGTPLLFQWDDRWGYASYGAGEIGYTGCGPTCLSMVVMALTGDGTKTPLAVAEYAEEAGYYVEGSGTSWSLMWEGCEAFGLQAQEIPASEDRVREALDGGKKIICSVGPGDFTDQGHFIVIAGCEGDSLIINDPNSRARSERVWSFSEIKDQIRNLWAYEKGT